MSDKKLKSFYRFVDAYFLIVTLADIWGVYRGFHNHKLYSTVMSMVATIVMVVCYIYIISGRIRHKESMKELNRKFEQVKKELFINHLN